MFCIVPSAQIKDQIQLKPLPKLADQLPQLDKTRTDIRRLSNPQFLIKSVSQGDVIMNRKVMFDNYLKSQVELMKGYVAADIPCMFVYDSFFSQAQINTSNLSIKEQWAFEIVLSRLNLSCIYQVGALNSMKIIFTQTIDSYREGFKATPQLIENISVTYHYFNQAYQPIKRLLPYFDAIESLASPSTKSKYLEVNKQPFQLYLYLLSINLAYLKIQKLRLLNEFKKCKQAAYAVYLRVLDSKSLISQIKKNGNLLPEIVDFFNLAQFFYKFLWLYFIIVEHEADKYKEEYGFIKKEFQQMIVDNLSVIDEIESMMSRKGQGLNMNNDNAEFGMALLTKLMEDVQKFKYRYNINIHENKIDKPTIENIIVRRIGSSNLWQSLDSL